MRARRIEPVDAAVRVLRPTQVDLRIVARVFRPQLEIPRRALRVDLPQPADPVHPAAAERVAQRDLAQPGERSILEPRGDRAARRTLAVPIRERRVAEPAFTERDLRTRARAHDGSV